MYINSFNPAIQTNYRYGNFIPISSSVNVQSQPITYQNQTNTKFINNYWQYQNYCGLNNQIYYNQELLNNSKLGHSILNDFKNQFPYLESYTMTDTLARKMEKTHPNSPTTSLMKTKSNMLFKKNDWIIRKTP